MSLNTIDSIIFYHYTKRIKQYIKQHIRENITLDDIATGLNASKKTLNPTFKMNTVSQSHNLFDRPKLKQPKSS